jgi:hypothetical protein
LLDLGADAVAYSFPFGYVTSDPMNVSAPDAKRTYMRAA